MKKLFTLLLLAPASMFAQVQEGGLFSVGFGYAHYDMQDWNVFLPDSASQFTDNAFSTQFNFGYIRNKSLYGLSASTMFQPTMSLDSIDVQAYNVDIKFDLGYLLIDQPSFIMIPTLGLGGGYDAIQMINTNNVSAAQIAANPGRELTLIQGKALADFSLQNLFVLGTETSNGERNSFVLGLRVGYTANYAIGNWGVGDYREAQVTDGPDGFRQMIYASVTIGGFSMDDINLFDKTPDVQ